MKDRLKILNFKNEKGMFSIEAGVIIPVILVISALIISFMVVFTFRTVKAADDAFNGRSCSEYVDETVTDLIIQNIFDFIEVVKNGQKE